MLKTKDEPLVFIRYGLSRKKGLLKDFNKLYDGLVVPANLLLYQYRGTPAIVYGCNQPFFVDPMSYLFAHPFNDFKKRIEKGGYKFKPSFAKLVEGYGENPDYFLQQSYYSLVDYLFKSENKLFGFIEKCLEFQWTNINDTINKSKDFLPEGKEVKLRPDFIVPPYLPYRLDDGTADLNIKILQYCWNERSKWSDTDIFPLLFIEKNNLTTEFIGNLKDRFADFDFPGYCIWIENFDEKNVTEKEIKGLIELVEVFSENQAKQIVILYGGFFNMLLYKYGVTCISHGIAYSEAKSMYAAVKQMGGGVPVRYYIPELHQFLTIQNSLIILRERPELICNCPVCQRIIQSDPEKVTRFEQEEELVELHFLYNRQQEKQLIAKMEKADIPKYLEYLSSISTDIGRITKQYKTYNGYIEKPIIEPGYIQKWKNALKATNDRLKL